MQLTIIVTSFNTEKYIAECFESILAQDINFDYEVIVGDDGSSDGTIDVIRQYESKFKNFSYFVQDREPGLKKEDVIPSIRVSNIIFKAMSMAKGDYVNLISSDDYFVNKTFFNNALDFLQKHKSYAGFVGNFYFAYPDGRKNFPYRIEKYKRFTFWSHHYIHISCFVYKNLSHTNTLLKLFCDDIGMQYSIGLNGKLKYISDFVFAYRQQEKSITHTQADDENAFLHMLFIQDVLNKKCPSLSKLYAWYNLFLFTPVRLAGFFYSLYEKRGTDSIKKTTYIDKYLSISKQYDNDIISALLEPSSPRNKELLSKVLKLIHTGEKLSQTNKQRTPCALPVPAYEYPVGDKMIAHKVEEFVKQKGTTYIKGWAFYGNTSSEIYIKANGRFYKTNMYSRQDIKDVFNSRNTSEGFDIKIHDVFDNFEFYLFDMKKKCSYIQPYHYCKSPKQGKVRSFFLRRFKRKSIMYESWKTQEQEQVNLLQQKLDLLENKQLIYETQNHYSYVRQHIQQRLSRGEKLRFASYVVYDTTYAMHGVMEQMLKEPEKYDVKFVICPDVYRDKDFSQYQKTRTFFTSRYGEEKVLDGYDMETGEFIDHSDKFDMVYMANPYDMLVNKVHSLRYLCRQNVLPIFINYEYLGSKWSLGHLIETPDFSLFYKVFAETAISKAEIAIHSILGGKNLVLSGYPRTDMLDKIKEVPHTKKRILIAPHQNPKEIPGAEELQWSNFLEYADFIPTLADLYPDVEFVFRPQSLLFKNLIWLGLWKQEKIDSYFELLESKHIIYSTEAEYLHLVKDCDAIIHDCDSSSFLVEWLYSGKPCCYVVDSEARVRGQFTKLGNFCLDKHFIANSRDKIIEFIDRFLNGEFPIKVDKDVKEKIMVNYPHASEYVLEHLLD